jgi:hypothetical protein
MGGAIGALFGLVMVATDCAGLGTLIAGSHSWAAMAIFLGGTVITFLPLVVATAIGILAYR